LLKTHLQRLHDLIYGAKNGAGTGSIAGRRLCEFQRYFERILRRLDRLLLRSPESRLYAFHDDFDRDCSVGKDERGSRRAMGV
jgi:hypothetical protein